MILIRRYRRRHHQSACGCPRMLAYNRGGYVDEVDISCSESFAETMVCGQNTPVSMCYGRCSSNAEWNGDSMSEGWVL